jgi:hypothetical protein
MPASGDSADAARRSFTRLGEGRRVNVMRATSREGMVRAFRVIADIDSGRDAWARAADGGAGRDCLDVVRSNVRSAQRIRP